MKNLRTLVLCLMTITLGFMSISAIDASYEALVGLACTEIFESRVTLQQVDHQGDGYVANDGHTSPVLP